MDSFEILGEKPHFLVNRPSTNIIYSVLVLSAMGKIRNISHSQGCKDSSTYANQSM